MSQLLILGRGVSIQPSTNSERNITEIWQNGSAIIWQRLHVYFKRLRAKCMRLRYAAKCRSACTFALQQSWGLSRGQDLHGYGGSVQGQEVASPPSDCLFAIILLS
jgi:hypothetical protein